LKSGSAQPLGVESKTVDAFTERLPSKFVKEKNGFEALKVCKP